jgi:hypothetical protein
MDQELVQYLDERFGRIEQRLDRHDRRFESIDRQFVQVNQRIDDRFEEVKRHTGVLAEDLRKEVHLLAEGLATHIEAENVRHQAIQEQFRETRALIHLSYEQLHQRVENLERNQQN